MDRENKTKETGRMDVISWFQTRGNEFVFTLVEVIFAITMMGLIDYHEQHTYAYELFNFERRDELEIRPLFNGQGIEARNSQITRISGLPVNAWRRDKMRRQ